MRGEQQQQHRVTMIITIRVFWFVLLTLAICIGYHQIHAQSSAPLRSGTWNTHDELQHQQRSLRHDDERQQQQIHPGRLATTTTTKKSPIPTASWTLQQMFSHLIHSTFFNHHDIFNETTTTKIHTSTALPPSSFATPDPSPIPYHIQVIIELSTLFGGLSLVFGTFVVVHFIYTRYENRCIWREWTRFNIVESTQQERAMFDLSFQNISYSIPNGSYHNNNSGRSSSRSSSSSSHNSYGSSSSSSGRTAHQNYVHAHVDSEKIILDNVYGSVKQGEICAIMGASGAGKSSLLDILAGRNKRGTVTGEIFLDESPIDHTYQLVKGYVLQENIMMSTMTVREYLMMSAQLRLPELMPRSEKEHRVRQVMRELGIEHLAQRQIGSNIKKGLSGGEKRRVALGAELVISRPILFCDEITSGLDSYNAFQVVKCLHDLARKHRKTIVMSIHQPSSAIFDLFDKLVLLSEGRVVFSGEARSALPHFQSLGFEQPEDFNTPDFILDLVVGASMAKQRKAPKNDVFSTILRKRKVQQTSAQDGDRSSSRGGGGGSSSNQSTTSNYAITYDDIVTRRTEYMEEPKFNLSELEQYQSSTTLFGWSASPLENSVRYASKSGLYNTSIYKQLQVLSVRAFKNFMRNLFLFPGHVLFSVAMGLILGGIFYKLPLDLAGTQNRIGIFFLLTVILSLVSMSSLEIFIAEREIYLTERASGYYRSLAYYISRMVFDVIPLRVIPPIILGSCCYFLAGLRTDDSTTFVWFLVHLTLFNIAMGGICLCISSVVHSVTVGNMIFLCMNLFTMLFGGLLINIRFVPFSLGIFQYISPYRYTLESLLVNELRDRIILFNPQGSTPVEVKSDEIIRYFGFSESNGTLNLGCLFGMATIFLILAAILLRFFVREKR